jgi:hypothetical protein
MISSELLVIYWASQASPFYRVGSSSLIYVEPMAQKKIHEFIEAHRKLLPQQKIRLQESG